MLFQARWGKIMDFVSIFKFFGHTSLITYVVLFWLSAYFITSFAILFARSSYLNYLCSNERMTLEAILNGQTDLHSSPSFFRESDHFDEHTLRAYKNQAEKKASVGLTWLSIIASTSPFIGLFGTVISILETFGGLGVSSSLGVIAPKISEALVATACGILVAIPAYSFHLILKRKAYELLNIMDSEIQILGSKR